MRAAKMAKRKRTISPPPTDDIPSNLPASLSSNAESVPDPGEWHADADADFATTEPPPSKKTRVEDVEDEDDVSGPREYYIEDFPWPAGDPILERGILPTFFELLRREKVTEGEDMWKPFSSWEEWELGRWLVRSGISQKEIDTFLNLESVRTISIDFIDIATHRTVLDSKKCQSQLRQQKKIVSNH